MNIHVGLFEDEKMKTTKFLPVSVLLGGLLLAAVAPVIPDAAVSASAAPAGMNVALAANGGTVTASGVEDPDRWTPAEANDGVYDGQSRWSSDHSDSAWIQVELAAPAVVDHVTIAWEAACAAAFKIQTSNDGTDWTDVSDPRPGTCSGTDRIRVNGNDPVQYVRMQGIERTAIGGKTYGMSLWEFEVWDGAESESESESASTPVGSLGLVPLPASVTEREEKGFILGPESRLVTTSDFADVVEQLAAGFRASTGYELPVVEGVDAGSADIRFASGASVGEGYTLSSGSTGILVTASTAHGAFNAAQTIRQLFPVGIESSDVVRAVWKAPALEITDAPRFGERGIMLDVARSFLTVAEVKDVIDRISAFKMNVLHLHLADDQGWRIEITNEDRKPGDTIDYTRLTSISGATAVTGQGFQDEPGHVGFYTQADYTELVEYAADRFVSIVPEIDLPGHTNAALAAIPELNTAGSSHPATEDEPTAPSNGTGDVGYSYLDPDSPATYTFVDHVVSQIGAITPSKRFHVGGDESHSMVARHGAAVFNNTVAKFLDIVHERGLKASGWNEISRTTSLRQGDNVQYWSGSTSDLPAAVAAGAKIVASNGATSYLDMKYTYDTPIGLTWACSGACDLTDYYDWDPATSVDGVPDSAIAGPEAPLWSETVRGGDQAEFLVFPRAIAHAEIGWSPQAVRNVADFVARVGVIGARLTAAGTNYYDTPRVRWVSAGVGRDVAARAGERNDFVVGTLFAPGTTLSADGATVSVDSLKDDDGLSNSDIGALTATVEWGDGTSSPATFRTDKARSVLQSSTGYVIAGNHEYATAGTHTGRVVGSDGRTLAEFVATVAETVLGASTPEALPAAPPLKISVTIDGKDVQQLIPGQAFDVTVTGALAGSEARVELLSNPIRLGSIQIGATGTGGLGARIPADFPDAGAQEVVVSAVGAAGPTIVRIPVTLSVASAPGGNGTSNGVLSETGAEGVPYFLAGLTSLLIVAAGVVLMRRRKRVG
jgi:hexosaminidase